MTDLTIREWQPAPNNDPHLEAELDMLAEALHACVHYGANIGFVLPFSMGEARSFWFDFILPAVRARKRRALLAMADGVIVGTVQIGLDTPANQRHRADIMKLLVHPRARGNGVARALMNAIEDVARAEQRTLLTLDTATGNHAERLYGSMGYTVLGVMPGHARGPFHPKTEDTTFFYKML